MAEALEQCRAELRDAEAKISEIKEEERSRVAVLEEKVTILVDAQVDLQNAEEEYRKVTEAGREEAQIGAALKEDWKRHASIEQKVARLLEGSCTKEKQTYLQCLRDYLQEIHIEKTLVAATDGFGVEPSKRGAFDQVAIDSIKDALAEKRRSLEELLAARAPAEKEAEVELLGLWALTDICREKALAAEAEHRKVEDEIKARKSVMRSLKQRVTKTTTQIAEMKEKLRQEAEAAEAKRVAEAEAAEAKRVAEAEAAEAKRVAEAEAAEAKRVAEAEAAEAKRVAEAEAAEAKRVAEAEAAEAKRVAEAEAAEAKRVEEAEALAEVRAVEEAAAAFASEAVQPVEAEVEEPAAKASEEEAGSFPAQDENPVELEVEEPAAKPSDEEVAATQVDVEVDEPPAKRLCTEESQLQVASPARAIRSSLTQQS